MKRAGILAAAALLMGALLVALCITRVPPGHFAVAGSRELGPGWRIHAPWVRAHLYAEAVSLHETLGLRTREGAAREVQATVSFSWDREALKRHPSGEDRVRAALRTLTQHTGAQLAGDIKGALSALPLRDVSVVLETAGELPQEVRAAYHPTGRKVVFLGLDALDWILVDKLISEGRMPTFARMKREGAWANLLSAKPLLSPLLWTSIATSRLPEEHGILEFVVKDPDTGKPAPITSRYRKVQAFWDIFSAFKLKVDVVGWWATYPAEKINGTLVTERLFFHLFGIETPKDVPGNTYPVEAEKRLKPLMVNASDIGYEEIRGYLHISEAEFRKAWDEGRTRDNPFDDPVNHLRKILAVTHSVVAVSEALLAQPYDVAALYLEGPDTVAHRFAQCLPPRLPWVSQEEFDRGKDALPRYYEEMDRVLARLMKRTPPDTLWIISSDHGFYTGEMRPNARPDDFTTGAPEWHRLSGVLIMAGPGVKPGKIENASIYDLIPTLAYAMGVPASREWKGRALTEAFAPAPPPAAIASYEFLPAPWTTAAAAVPDAERIKELQALGYIGGEVQAPAPPQGSPPSVPEDDFLQAYNRANSFYQQGNIDKAMEEYRRSVDLRPGFSGGMFALAQCYAMKKDHAEAYDWLKRSLRYPENLPPKVLIHLMDEAKEIDQVEDALALLNTLRSTWQKESAYSVALGIGRAAQGREAEAVALFEQALRLQADNSVAAEELLRRYIEGGQTEKASALLRRTWDASAGSLQTMNYLGVVCLRNGQGRIAEDIFRKILKSDPDNAGILGNLAAALQMQGRSADAVGIFARAARLQPDNAQLHYNYGACLSELGRSREALDVFLKAKALNLQNPLLYTALGKVYFRLGRRDDAKEALRRSLALDPGQSAARDMLETLEKE